MKDQTQTPFFVRYLETQETIEVNTDVKAGGRFPNVTMKYPSDNDEGGPTI